MEPNDDLRMRINKYIDHTLLKPDATPQDVELLCAEARQYQFYSVCVNPYYVKRCVEQLSDTNIAVACAVGFPLGMMTSEIKAAEARTAIYDGADEIDMVINIGELKAGNDGIVERDIRAVVETAQSSQVLVKVIIETGLLNDEEKQRACKAAKNAGAHFVKTSTGFGPGGATQEDIRLMLAAVEGELSVKASGGIRCWDTAKKMMEAGASRLGTSSGVAIINGARGVKASENDQVKIY